MTVDSRSCHYLNVELVVTSQKLMKTMSLITSRHDKTTQVLKAILEGFKRIIKMLLVVSNGPVLLLKTSLLALATIKVIA